MAYDNSVQTSQLMELQGTITVADGIRFQYFHTMRRVWPFAAGAIGFLLVVFPLMGLAAIDDSEWMQVLKNSAPFGVMLLLWIGILTVAPYRNALKQRSIQAALREPITYTFSSENVRGHGESVSWSMAWDVFRNIRETKSLFLMYHHPQIAVIVPKHFFAGEDEMAQWRQMIASCAPTKVIESPGVVGRWC